MVAWLALGVAIVGVLWGIFNTFWLQRPRLHAEIDRRATITVPAIPPLPAGESITMKVEADMIAFLFTVTALNTGSEPSTIWDVGLSRREGEDITSASGIVLDGGTVDGPTVPARIEPHGALSWTFTDEQTNHVPPGEEIYGWVSRYRPLRKWRTTERAARRRENRANPSNPVRAEAAAKKRVQRVKKSYRRYTSSHGEVRYNYGYVSKKKSS
ncbi:hypothetical protein [Leifsonia sp. NPDC058248]|uniref:hypothetical protein n=1 Tax=Leifsonia sp. NPDC058248 TaxID=3346402 RepID=UPI0036DB9140